MSPDVWAGSRPVECCDLCRGEQFEPLDHLDRNGRPLTTVLCRRCGLVSHDRVPAEDALQRYYQQAYRREYHGEFMPSAYRVVREWKRAGRLLRQVSPYLQPVGRVFEVGSGIGCSVKRFELAGFEASGIEPGEGFWRFSRRSLHARVARGVLDDVRPRACYDLVLLVHVLEHLTSPRRALERIRRMLRPGGRLYVEVPAFGSPHAAPGKLFHFAHIYNFTPATLASLGRAVGLEVERVLPSDNDKDQRVLFRRPGSLRNKQVESEWLDLSGAAQARAAVQRYSTWSYYLRGRYVTQRLRSLTLHSSDRVAASLRMRHILRLCERSAMPAFDEETVFWPAA